MDFLSPAALALGALAAPLVALYFLRIRRRRVRVSSLLAWHALRQQEKLASPFQRFRRHPLLWLQLALLAALTLAAARPWLATVEAPWRSVVLVVDTSASMGAQDEIPHRLGEAVRRADALLAGLGPTDEAMLIAAGPRTEVRVPFTRDEARVQSALATLRPTEAQGDLGDALKLAVSLARSRPDVEVVVLSDGGPHELSGVPTSGVPVRYERVGRARDNAAIVALDLRRNPVHDLERQLFVTVNQFGRAPVEATVEVTLEDRLVGLRPVTVQPDEPVSLVFDLSGRAEGLLRVRVDSPGDLLPADDVAWAVLEPTGARRVLLVGGDALTARALLADPRISLEQASPAQVTTEFLADYDAVLFGGPAPDELDGLNYAILGPSYGGPVRFGAEVPRPNIVEWHRSHALLRFVSLDGVLIGRGRQVQDTGGLLPVVQGDGGPLVLAGERGGGRVVQLAFDPLESDLPMRVAWPVLLLNTVGWLTGGDPTAAASAAIQAGQPFVRRLPEGVTHAEARGPDGPVSASVDGGTLRIGATDRVGVYTVQAGPVRTRFAANLLSEQESRIAPRMDLGLTLGDEVAEASLAVGRRELWRELLLLALGLALMEWLVWSRRRAS